MMLQYTLLLVFGVAVASADKFALPIGGTAKGYCALIDASINVQIKLENATEPIKFAVNGTTDITGNCNGQHGTAAVNELTINFFPDGVKPPATEGQQWRLTFFFAKTEEGAKFELADYELWTAPSHLFNTSTEKFGKLDSAEVDVRAMDKNGFKCSKSALALENDGVIELSELRVIANAHLDTAEFPAGQTYELCPLDSRTSDVVPIVVGACLAGLVVVVLVAYLIGRARAKRQGYASV